MFPAREGGREELAKRCRACGWVTWCEDRFDKPQTVDAMCNSWKHSDLFFFSNLR